MPDLSVLFWNVKRNDVSEHVAAMVTTFLADVVVLCECSDATAQRIERVLHGDSDRRYYRGQDHTGRSIRFLSTFEDARWQVRSESPYASFRTLTVPGREQVIIGAVHLLSKCDNRSQSQQKLGCAEVAHAAAAVEGMVGHRRAMLIGDFNVDPFEPGMLHADGLFGMIAIDDASATPRTIGGRQYLPFHNPMWTLYGDGRAGAAATHRFVWPDVECTYWHMYDQVLLRPELAGRLGNEVRIVTQYPASSGGAVRLDGGPNGSPDPVISDHFPLLVRAALFEDRQDER